MVGRERGGGDRWIVAGKSFVAKVTMKGNEWIQSPPEPRPCSPALNRCFVRTPSPVSTDPAVVRYRSEGNSSLSIASLDFFPLSQHCCPSNCIPSTVFSKKKDGFSKSMQAYITKRFPPFAPNFRFPQSSLFLVYDFSHHAEKTTLF